MKNQKGITLIALVITIIVLLILAGVSIAMLTGENGLLNRASGANAETVKAEVKEKINLTLNAVKTSVYAERVNVETYTGITEKTVGEGDAATTTKDLDETIVKLIKADLGNNTTNTGTAENGKYDYKLNTETSTLTISYIDSTNDVPKIAGSIVLSGTMTITPAAEAKVEAPKGE